MTDAPVADGRARRLTKRVANVLVLAMVIWGAFAFGAVYRWAYIPLALVAGAFGIVSAVVPGGPSLKALRLRSLAVALVLLVLAIVVQLVPLPWTVVDAVSPAARDLLTQFNPMVAVGLVPRHALSIAPSHTVTGLALFTAFAALVIGAARVFSVVGVRTTARAIVTIGIVLAVVGIVQRPLYAGRIYGLWELPPGRNPFGPFINKNHFAGWMLMVLPLAFGVAAAHLSRAHVGARDVRERIVWLSSPDGSRLLLWAAAIALMGLSIVMTLSRSGIAIAAVIAVFLSGAALRSGRTSRTVSTAVVVACVGALGAVGWLAADLIAMRFSEADWSDFNTRTGAWSDAIAIAARYPIAGTGFNTYGIATLFYQQHDLVKHYREAHNDYLQLAAEGGVLLMLPAVSCFAVFCVIVRRRFREETSLSTSWIRFGAVTGLLAIALQSVVDFSLQMPGNAALFAILCAIAAHQTPARRTSWK